MEEIWKPLPGRYSCYEVSDLGGVRKNGEKRKASVRKEGYLSVTLYGDGASRSFDVHLLVMLAFRGPPPPGHNVNHRDGNKLNPALSNLEYVTFSANSRHAMETGLWDPSVLRNGERKSGPGRGSMHPNSRLSEAAVTVIRTRLAAGESASRIAGDFGVTKWAIYNVKRGTHWQHAA